MRSFIHKTLKPSPFLLSTITTATVNPLSISQLHPNPVRSMSSGRIFQLKLDPLTGKSEWVVIEEEDEAHDAPPQQPLLAATSYLDMLNDSRRNRAFREAIDKTITKPCHVLDIGLDRRQSRWEEEGELNTFNAGTGLLSMMAARAMDSAMSTACSSSEGAVTACESYLPMVKLMRKVLRLNGMERKVRVINKRSDELEVGVDITSRADILVSEILDSELLGEGLIPTLQHAHDKLLVENPQTVPYRATTYGQLVESKYLWKLHDLFDIEAKASDDIRLVPTKKETILCVKAQQFAMHCDAIKDEIKLLSEPFKIFEFDFWKRPESRGETKLHIKATNDGTVHAVVSWWILQLDCEGTIYYSTGPKWISFPFNMELQTTLPRDWCDHWKQCVYFIPGKGLPISKDEELHLHATHNDTSISYEFETQARGTEIDQYEIARDDQLILPPERVAIYGDSNWRWSVLKAVKKALQGKVSSLCLVVDDSVFLTIAIAHLSKTSHVIALFPGLREKGAKYLQAVAVANGFSMDQIEVLGKRKDKLTMHDTHQKKVELLVGEPYYYGNDSMLPWQNLRFWKERTALDPVLASDALIMPCKGVLKACAMSLPDLWRSRRCLSQIEGFDHSAVNATLGACGDLPEPQESPCLPFFIWQCGENKCLSEVFTVMEFDFSKPISQCFGKAQVEFTEARICHGFALWIDWVIDVDNSIVLSTGPDQRHWKQGVKLLAEPVTVGTHGSSLGNTSAEIETSFNPSSGELNIKYVFT
ncbi:protein arginine N-methyltransferase 7 isoform X2 [Actinidia eriantha]|uniref:protein arginine N-methyltransferase 7 isoform X2 n=1 Tax=Actinidia eriantha TaxID=165200 RepID=UPI0025830103|nr:protein arginine N-methyltransferase 7 isoform X2 [Actinidia eriantha]